MRIPLSMLILAFFAQGCVTTPRQWKVAAKSEVAGLCDDLVHISRLDTLQSRKETMDKFGFETTSYSDGISRVSVLTRPDLVVVVTHAIPKATVSWSNEEVTNRMWNAVSMQVEAIHTTTKSANYKIETIFMAQELRWNKRVQAFQQLMTEKFDMQTLTLEKTISSASPTANAAEQSIEADIL